MSLTGRYAEPLEESKTTDEILSEIRALMQDSEIVGSPIDAYIITSVDAHQACFASYFIVSYQVE